MKKSRLVAAFAVVTIALVAQVYASPTVTTVAPKITFTGTSVIDQAIATQLNSTFQATLESQWNTMATETNKSLAAYGSQNLLAKGFGNANAYSAQTATMQGYQGYDLFAVSGGLMIGAQLPSFDPAALTKIADEVQTNPDVYAGVAPSVNYLNIGLHAGPIFGIFSKDLGNTMKNFYFNLKFGGLNTNYKQGSTSVDVNSSNFGIGVNYQLLSGTPDILWGLFKLRGLSLGSGLNVQSNKVNVGLTLDPISQAISATATDSSSGVTYTTTGTLSSTPKINLGVDITTVSIPLEATTSVQLLWLANVNFGLGADLVFGSSNVIATGSGTVTVSDLKVKGTGITSVTGTTTKDGNFTLEASTKNIAPDLLRARIMTGFGFNLGPVKIDIPLYYYLASGFAFGITGAVVW